MLIKMVFCLIINLVFEMTEIVSKRLVDFFYHICKSLDDQKCNLVDAIFLDFSSAFDKVDHNLLIAIREI